MEHPIVIINEAASVSYLPKVGAVVTTSKPKAHTTPVQTVVGNEYAPWGDDNLFPQNVVTLAEKTFIPSVINWQVRALGTKLQYGIEEVDDNGRTTFKRVKDPQVEEWLRRSNFGRYIVEAGSDFYWFMNAFPEIVLSNDRSQIVSVCAQEASYCRYQKQNPNTGLSEYVYINANWDNGGTVENSAKVPVIDPYYDPVTALRERKDSFKYIYPISFPSPGKSYYQVAPWDSIRKNGWLEIASLIPTWKKSLMSNQLNIKYHIDVPEYWWKWKYSNWDKMTPIERKSAINDELTNFNNFFQGASNAGNSMMTQSKFDEISRTKYPGWEIKAIDDKLADGKYIEDSQEASSHLMFALGLDSTLIAAAPGKGMGAGSGSDKRVAFNIYMQLQQTNEHLLLEPLRFVQMYNNWNPEYVFKLERSVITTLDKGTETQTIA